MATNDARSQPDDDPVIQSFLAEFSKEPGVLWRTGRGGAANNLEKRYLSYKILQQKLDVGRVQELLNALFKGRDEHPPHADRVTQHYLRTFAILMRIGFGRMILYFIKGQLKDSHLPYLSKPPKFPSSSNQIDLFSEFYKEQWGFCAQLMEYDMGYQLEPNIILPILNLEVIDQEGGSATMYKIVVDEDYNEIMPKDDSDTAKGNTDRNTFALKHYRTQEARNYYETESGAFKRLRYQNRPRHNIVAFYGGFERENNYNIILEYADGGNLDQYMENTEAPTNHQERYDFWSNFLEVLDGLAIIHGEGGNVSHELQILLGWHQDINPTNILVKTRPDARSIYDCHFKIADLGLSHFIKHIPGFQTVTDKDTFGTRAYGAPETFRADLNIARSNLQVKQNVDTWSMGCVLSEVVTWACQGWQKVVLYRQLRAKEIEICTGQREDRFHQDWKLLQAIQDAHHDNKENCRRNDEFTPRITDYLVNEMIQVQGDARPTARWLYGKAARIIGDISGTSNGIFSGERIGSLRRIAPTKSPPQLPPHHRRGKSSNSSQSHPSPSIMTSGLATQSPPLTQDSYGTEVAYGHDSLNVAGLRKSPSGDVASSPYWSLDSLPAPDQEQLSQWPAQSQISQAHSKSHRIIPNYAEDSTEDPFIDSQTPKKAETRNLPLFNNTSSAYDTRPKTSAIHADVMHCADSSTSKLPSTVAGKRPMSDDISPSPTESAAQRRPDWKPPPELLLKDALELLTKRLPFPDADRWLKELRGRDHAFVVDNSTSSQPFRQDMKIVLKVLAAILGSADPDGPDLYFTGPYRRLKRQGLQSILDSFEATPLEEHPDMRRCLAAILDEYQTRFGKWNLREKIRNPKSTPSKNPRKLNLYVLTDGIWQPNTDLIQEIDTQVAHLWDRKLTDKQVGIQFIRFGEDPHAIRRLRKLDNELGLKLDIIDTTPATGSIWKMLLGAINDWFDDDPQAEDRQPGYHERIATGTLDPLEPPHS